MEKRLLLLEVNELCPDLLKKWMGQGELPNFSRFYEDSDVFVTKPDVTDAKELEPWIQWYSIHTGIDYASHGVFHLSDGPKGGHTDIWTLLREANVSVGNFGSMNAAGFEKEGSFFFPDPWTTSETAYPQELKPLQDFIQSQVQEHTNPNQSFGVFGMVRVLFFLMTHGLHPSTIQRILKQLSTEKFKDPKEHWRRVVLLDWISADVFRHYMRRFQPGFATFFSNSIAHCQHAYWRCMEPESFDVKPSAEDQARYGDAILFAYKNTDEILGELFALEDQGYNLVLAGALSQQPFLRQEETGGQRFYRLHDVDLGLTQLGISYDAVRPVMTHQYMVHFTDKAKRDMALARLKAFAVNDKPLFQADPSDETSLYLGNTLRTVLPSGQYITNAQDPECRLNYDDLFYLIGETKSGSHHPDGVLWFKNGAHRLHNENKSILDVAPTVLDWFNIPQEKRTAPLMGASLIDVLNKT